MRRSNLLSSKQCLELAVDILKRRNIKDFRLEAEIIVSHILDINNRVDLYLKDVKIDDYQSFQFRNLLKKRIKNYPIQYLTKRAFFYGLEFRVTEGVFIPRPETEILVDYTLNLIKDKEIENPEILDIGTGCGNIAISLTKSLSNCKMTATDISRVSLKIAQENAKRHNVLDKITFLEGDLFSPVDCKRRMDIIVCNPPYVTSDELGRLQAEVKKEPKLALWGGEDGLFFYKRIIEASSLYLKPSGYLIFELAEGRREAVYRIFESNPLYKNIHTIKDYNNIDRVIIAQML